jgi:hypothetical protein
MEEKMAELEKLEKPRLAWWEYNSKIINPFEKLLAKHFEVRVFRSDNLEDVIKEIIDFNGMLLE